MANNAVLRNNAPQQSVIRIAPASGVNVWDASRRMQFSVISSQLGSNISLSSTGIVRLNTAGTYKMTAVWQGTQSTGGATIQWYNESISAFVGSSSVIAPCDSTNATSSNSVLIHIVNITGELSFSVRDTGGGNLQPNASNSYIIIEQVNTLITNQSNSISGNVINGGNLVFNNLIFTATTTGGAGILLSTTSGTVSANINARAISSNAFTFSTHNTTAYSITTTPANPWTWNAMNTNNNIAELFLRDLTNNKYYYIIVNIGATTHFLSIQQLL
jgi:hypothetical protein